MISPEILRRYPYFAGLSSEQLAAIAMTANEEEMSSGQFFFHEGDILDNVYIVLEGEVAILVELPEKEDEVVVSTTGPGEVCAWGGLVPPFKANFSVKAVTDGKVIAFDCAQLRETFEKDCGLGYVMMLSLTKVMQERIRDLRIELMGSIRS
jgi:CRP/FNR family cyclic AMP-dependent transcriptional regulator